MIQSLSYFLSSGYDEERRIWGKNCESILMQKYVYVESLRREYECKITTSTRKEYSTKRSRRIASTRTTILGVFLIDTTYLAGKLAPPRLYLVVLRCQPVVTRDYLPRSIVLFVAFYAAILPKYRLIKCPVTYDLLRTIPRYLHCHSNYPSS